MTAKVCPQAAHLHKALQGDVARQSQAMRQQEQVLMQCSHHVSATLRAHIGMRPLGSQDALVPGIQRLRFASSLLCAPMLRAPRIHRAPLADSLVSAGGLLRRCSRPMLVSPMATACAEALQSVLGPAASRHCCRWGWRRGLEHTRRTGGCAASAPAALGGGAAAAAVGASWRALARAVQLAGGDATPEGNLGCIAI